MPFDRDHRQTLLRSRAAAYVAVAVANATREFPHMPYFVATAPGPHPSHREFHPAFYGSFDWHSCVEMHWTIVRLLRLFPGETGGEGARATLDGLLTPEHIAIEMRFFDDPDHRSLERPYGWGWLLKLAAELAAWDDPDGRRWSAAVGPLADLLVAKFLAWLPLMTYPQRGGAHPNTAFGLSLSLPYADILAARGDPSLRAAIDGSALGWFSSDRDYPARYEPSGGDFLSAALTEAELIGSLLEPQAFARWLDGFLPTIGDDEPAVLTRPAHVSDSTDGQIAHLIGLNISRAYGFVAIGERLPASDRRIPVLLRAAKRHADAGLPLVVGSHYMAEHWLAAYATLLLS